MAYSNAVQQRLNELENEKEKIRMSSRLALKISVLFVILLVVSFTGELLMLKFVPQGDWVAPLFRIFVVLAMVSPVGVMVPLFFWVNLKGKIRKNEKAQEEVRKNNPQG